MELQVKITNITRSEFKNRDKMDCKRAEVEAVEVNVPEGKFTNRVVFSLYDVVGEGTHNTDNINEGDLGTVTVNVDRKELTTRDGRKFWKNECSVVGWKLVTPKAF